MPHPLGFGERPRSRWRDARLLVLAAALLAATVYSAVSIVHGKGERQRAAALVARAVAEHFAARTSWRLELLSLGAFAPVTLDPPTRFPNPSDAVTALVERQRSGVACQCREILPVSAFFAVDLNTNRVTVRAIVDAVSPSDSTLRELARRESGEEIHRGPSLSHLSVDPALGSQAAVTVVEQHDGRPRAVYGLLADRSEFARVVFGSEVRHAAHAMHTARAAASTGDSAVGIVRLDSLSIQVAAPNTVLFGRLGSGRYTATSSPIGPLQGISVTAALARDQIPSALLSIAPTAWLWHNTILLASTVLVMAIAMGALRREVRLARARADFVAGVSHDLRMPLAQILIAGETLTLDRAKDDAEKSALANSVVREARRLVGLVENVLLFSRSGAVRLTARRVPVPARELIDDAVESVRLAVSDAGQAIMVDAPEDLVASADRNLIRQALVNLLDNALKYGPRGQQIRVSAERGEGTIRIVVDDRGPGVPAAERAKLFTAYERLDRDRTSERTGSGLGLAVVHHIAEVSGGSIRLEDAPGGGTRAVLTLPAAP